MEEGITYVGLDVHQASTVVALMLPTGEFLEDRFATSSEGVGRWVRKLKRRSQGPIVSCYEAGPTGYSLQRMLEEHAVECRVIAPSLIPQKPGERIKTDRRDARKLVELLAADLLTEVHAPTPEQEAIRDLCRARASVKGDQKRVQHRLSKFLLRRGIRWTTGRRMWTGAHRAWLRGLRLDHEADQITLEDHLLALEQIEGRLQRLDEQIDHWAGQAPYAEAVGWLRCFRGIDTLTALSVAAEIHDWRRFPSPRALMAYLGLVPSESSSGSRFQRGRLTRAGNSRVRRLLIEAAWHYRHPPRVGNRLAKRREGQPASVITVAERAQRRLHNRYRRLTARGKAHNQVVAAVGRELVGFLWAVMQEPPREGTA